MISIIDYYLSFIVILPIIMLKDLSFSEQRKEIQKPIYKEYAKRLWDACYQQYKDPKVVGGIASLLVLIIELESKGKVKGDILSILHNPSEEALNEYFSLYDNLFIHDWIVANMSLLCDVPKITGVLSVIKDSIENLEGKDYYYLINGGDFDEGPWYLSDYTKYMTEKTLVRTINNNKVSWALNCHDGSVIPLEDLVCAWEGPYNDYFRFLDCHGRWGFLDAITLERHYMPTEYHSIGNLSCDKAWFYVDGKGYGYCNVDGEVVIPIKFSSAEDFEWVNGVGGKARVKYLYEYGPKYAFDQTRRNIARFLVYL